MQASKIIPHKEYAIKRNGKLVTFHVMSVHQVRYGNSGSPRDYKASVKGHVVPDAYRTDSGVPLETLELQPDQILGPVAEYMELIEAKRLKEETYQREVDAKKEIARKLTLLLYAKAGVPPPDRLDEYRIPFQHSSYGVNINEEGVVLLTRLLARVGDPAVQ